MPKFKNSDKSRWKVEHVDDPQLALMGFNGIEVLEPDDGFVVERKILKRKNESVQKVGKSKKKRREKIVCADKKEKITKKVLENVDRSESLIGSQPFMEEMTGWKKFGLCAEILKALHEMQFLTPTPIQKKCIEAAITSKESDIIAAAETGSGKTYAYGVPIIQEILSIKKKDQSLTDLLALVVAPTRELAAQIYDHLSKLCRYTSIRIVLVVGGLARQKQERLLGKKPEVVVGTPGRLWDLFQEKNEHILGITRLRMLVVDEADRMMEANHFQELGLLLGHMNHDANITNSRRNFVFSATLTYVHDLPLYRSGKTKKVGKQKLKNLLEKIGVKRQIIYDLSNEQLTPATLTEWKIFCDFSSKDFYLVYFLLTTPGRTIIFCNSIGCVRRLANLLNILNLKPFPLHANMQQNQRLKNLDRFRAESNAILLATDVAARGLDIPSVGHVVHYQVPRTAETYVHRSGRTARQLASGNSLLLVSFEESTQYQQLMKSLKRSKGVPDFATRLEDLSKVKNIVNLAREIADSQLLVRKRVAESTWFENAVKNMDICCDDDGASQINPASLKSTQKAVKFKTAELMRLLKPFQNVSTSNAKLSY